MINFQNLNRQKLFCPPMYGEFITNGQGRSYSIGKTIGQGYFGCVYECTDEWGNELVAKIIVPKNRTYEQVRQEWIEELNKLEYLRHPNITYIYDAFEYQDTFYLIIERCYCTLKDLLVLPDDQRERLLPCIARDLLQGIDFIHSCGYVHKDIHHGNVFVSLINNPMLPNQDPVLKFKIGDLGISRLENDINTFNTILANWMLPPEFLNPTIYGQIGRKVDIYHTGLLLLSLLVGYVTEFTQEEILNGTPRQMAEKIPSPYSYAIAKALRRHVAHRTETALDFWREILEASKSYE
ncbi:protein kinase family protein [Nostoc sp. FACHB-87]|uniref:protein kinase family protein n=1 Tax=Nostocaceae TaxID=1162 RepID=UPI001683F41E|nr:MULTISPECIES: protein kinase family protein [Nostocaceae]MBD2453648.1 protein kinase family protein [Nostoc sp. FACHB-87]MBD2475398.1 protein kinase family protein [Anabaena sp. FACHB-83]